MEIKDDMISEPRCPDCNEGNVSAFAVYDGEVYFQCNHCGTVFWIDRF